MIRVIDIHGEEREVESVEYLDRGIKFEALGYKVFLPYTSLGAVLEPLEDRDE